ncbi:hypothetical protein EKE94_14195 [Mesobaculum littorinae]|uniref:Uncharacterized protein n=1 Tax=Mesobaculum littorinae TaxID=2486419 RepID=A0A438AEY1_9RHOB|nr:hypothetical protein [Mesobaculum littorinae]RVV97175.1 hypothetical protein EKE94_14195 [Mesobaculum littorinae]
MTMLTDEQERRLREAREQLEAAQKTIAELEGVRRRLYASRRKRARHKVAPPKGPETDVVATNVEDTCENSVPVSNSLERLLRHRKQKAPLPEPAEIKRVYEELGSLGRVAKALGRDRRETAKALAAAGIDIREDIARQWESGSSLRELRERHGLGCDTISRWIKSTGRTVEPRNANRKCDEQLIVETYLETRSANRCAQVAGVSWGKARDVLRQRGMWEK